jgi:uncharacterized DUF497 family protein
VSAVHFGDFVWDSRKATANLREHGVTFEEAATVFDDPRAIDAPDLYNDGRFVILGRSARDRVLFVVHAVVDDERIRLISARKATRTQREAWERDAPRGR